MCACTLFEDPVWNPWNPVLCSTVDAARRHHNTVYNGIYRLHIQRPNWHTNVAVTMYSTVHACFMLFKTVQENYIYNLRWYDKSLFTTEIVLYIRYLLRNMKYISKLLKGQCHKSFVHKNAKRFSASCQHKNRVKAYIFI